VKGTVDFQFTATSANTSDVDITGKGTNSSLFNALADDVLGYAFFGTSALSVADECLLAGGEMAIRGT